LPNQIHCFESINRILRGDSRIALRGEADVELVSGLITPYCDPSSIPANRLARSLRPGRGLSLLCLMRGTADDEAPVPRQGPSLACPNF
jgi:hypothetical protein